MIRFSPQTKLASTSTFHEFVAGKKVFPVSIEISPCHVCQAGCEWCFWHGTHEKMNPASLLDWDLGRHFLADFRLLGGKSVAWTGGGEPTLHPEFNQFLRTADTLGLKQGLFTNALKSPTYNPSYLEWIRVSNTDHPWPIENLKRLRGETKTLGLACNYVGDDKLIHDALEVGECVKVDYVQVRQALNLRGAVTDRKPPEINHPLLHITGYKFEDSPKPHSYTKCRGYHFVPFLWHNGDLDVCSYHRGKGKPFTLGNITQRKYQEIIEDAPAFVPVAADCQVCCKNDQANQLLEAALTVQDRLFI